MRILELAEAAGAEGITSNDAERLITDHKNSSVSPRFNELVEAGALVRMEGSAGERIDPLTNRPGQIHWLPKFAPDSAKKPAGSAEGDDQSEMFAIEGLGS